MRAELVSKLEEHPVKEGNELLADARVVAEGVNERRSLDSVTKLEVQGGLF